MKQAASIKIITNQEKQRYEFMTNGTVSFEICDTAFIEYGEGDSAVAIGVSPDTVTITHLGGEPYTLISKQGDSQPVTIGNVTFAAYTSKMRQKHSDGRIDVLVEYNLSLNSIKGINTRYRIICTY